VAHAQGATSPANTPPAPNANHWVYVGAEDARREIARAPTVDVGQQASGIALWKVERVKP